MKLCTTFLMALVFCALLEYGQGSKRYYTGGCGGLCAGGWDSGTSGHSGKSSGSYGGFGGFGGSGPFFVNDEDEDDRR